MYLSEVKIVAGPTKTFFDTDNLILTISIQKCVILSMCSAEFFCASRIAGTSCFQKQSNLVLKVALCTENSLEDYLRQSWRQGFIAGGIDVLVCTMASFGTGVDMPGVRTVIIHGLPQSIHLLVQLVGRGGHLLHEHVLMLACLQSAAFLALALAALVGADARSQADRANASM